MDEEKVESFREIVEQRLEACEKAVSELVHAVADMKSEMEKGDR